MAKPVDFENEIGGAFDSRQLTVMGHASLILGVLLSLIVLLPNLFSGRLLAAGVAGTVLIISGILKFYGRQSS